jgi:hypothetical protein
MAAVETRIEARVARRIKVELPSSATPKLNLSQGDSKRLRILFPAPKAENNLIVADG